ncbi:MAG: hypothetical protein ACKOKE_01340 [Actinomycetota bacterium]
MEDRLSWLLLVALGMLWAAFLNPTKKLSSPAESVRDFGIDMGRLAAGHDEQAVRIARALAAARARDRRRRLLVALLSVAVGGFVLGLFEPLRWMWLLSGMAVLVLTGFVWVLRSMRVAAPRRVASRAMAPRPTVPLADLPLDGSEGEIVVRRIPRAGGD